MPGLIQMALQTVFSHRRYFIPAFLVAALMFGVLIFLPVGRVSAAVLYYQVTSLDALSLGTMIGFSILLGILFSMNIYLFQKTHLVKEKTLGRGVLSLFSSFVAGLFGSSVCLACLSILLGFLGMPIITALLAYQKPLFLLSALIAIGSLYLTSRAIVEHDACAVCRVH